MVSSTLPRIERPALFTSTSNRPNASDGLADQPLDVVLPGDVGVDGQHVMAGRLHLGGRLLDRLGLQGGDGDLAPGGGELLGDHAPQAAGAAGDQDDLVLPESHGDRGPGAFKR